MFDQRRSASSCCRLNVLATRSTGGRLNAALSLRKSISQIRIRFVRSGLHQKCLILRQCRRCLLTRTWSRHAYNRIWLDRLWVCADVGHVGQRVCSYNGDLRNLVRGASLDCVLGHSVCRNEDGSTSAVYSWIKADK